jgi:rubrerythrin
MRDVAYDPTEESPYECFTCGTVVVAGTNPGTCDDCGSPMRNRLTPIE